MHVFPIKKEKLGKLLTWRYNFLDLDTQVFLVNFGDFFILHNRLWHFFGHQCLAHIRFKNKKNVFPRFCK